MQMSFAMFCTAEMHWNSRCARAQQQSSAHELAQDPVSRGGSPSTSTQDAEQTQIATLPRNISRFFSMALDIWPSHAVPKE